MSWLRPFRALIHLVCFAPLFIPLATPQALRDWGNRYEGLVDRPNALRDYELLGFFAYREPWELVDDVNLRVLFYVPAVTPAFLQVQEIRPEKSTS